jgi:phage tail sheath gpL-like
VTPNLSKLMDRRAVLVMVLVALLGAAACWTGALPAPVLGSLLLAAVGISFNNVPSNLLVPFVTAEFDSTKASQGAALLPYRALIIGQKTAAGSATANALYKVTSVAQAIPLVGRGSMLHRQLIAWFANNTATEVWILVIADNGAGVAATGTLTFSGSATASGTWHLYFGGTYVPVAVASGDSASTQASAVNTAINAALDLPITSTVNAAVVTWTFRHKGLVGNDFDVRANYQDGESAPAGGSVTIVAASGGTTNPTLTSGIAALGDNWYQIWSHPYTDATSLTAIETELASRTGPMRMIDGVAITSAAGTQSALGTLGDSRNSPHSCIAAQPGKNPVTPPMEYAAAVAGVVALYGAIDPARPFHTLTVLGIAAPTESDRYTFTERNLELLDGIATSRVAADGTVVLETLVTTYQTNAAGAADTSYRMVTTMLTLLYLRYSFRVFILTNFPRVKLADDGVRVGPGQAIITPKIGMGAALAWFRQMEELGLVENFEQFKADLVVERNGQDPNRLDFLLPPDLINQFIVGAAKIQFRV